MGGRDRSDFSKNRQSVLPQHIWPIDGPNSLWYNRLDLNGVPKFDSPGEIHDRRHVRQSAAKPG